MSGRQSNMQATHPHAGIAAWNFKAKAEVQSYEQGDEFLGDANERELGSNVKLRRASGVDGIRAIQVVLYRTPIVTYYKDRDAFAVSNGGYRTPTTMYRVNRFTPDGYHFCHRRKRLCRWINGRYENTHGKIYPVNEQTHRAVPAGWPVRRED